MGSQLEEVVAHPLFPIGEDDDDDEIRTVTSIHVARKENGKLMFAPRPRRADELQSLEQIHAEFGGGEYCLIGYNNGRITARKTINLSGKSKPLFDDGIEQITEKPAPAQVINPMMAMMGGGDTGGIMGLIMMMMQQMMQQQAASAASQTQMFIAMMQNSRESSSEEKAQARAELQANIERERISSERTMSLMREMMQSKGQTGSGEDFTRGVEFYRSFANAQIEMARATAKESGDDGVSSILETLMQAFQGYQALQEMKNGVSVTQAAGQVVG